MSDLAALVIQPRDPVIFRDARPFATGLPGHTLPFAPPSVLAGAVRTRLGQVNGSFDTAKIPELKRMEFCGPLLAYREFDSATWHIAPAAPADILLHEKGPKKLEWAKLRPKNPESRLCDLPPGMLPLFGAPEAKPYKDTPMFWTWQSMQSWLKGETPSADPKIAGFGRLQTQRRVHVKITSATQVAEEAMLYSTEGLEFIDANRKIEFAVAAKVRTTSPRTAALSHIGGEGRSAYWDWSPNVHWPEPPFDLGKLEAGQRIRMILATPAIFRQGWKPDWLKDANEGSPPGMPDLKLKLKAAAVPRAVPLSGWDYEIRKPKPTRLMVPAGSVYFFEILKGSAVNLWLRSVCDEDQDQLDGFGRVLIGKGDWE